MAGITRPLSQMRKAETKEAVFRNRKRILKYLVVSYLKQEGYFQSADTFTAEAALTGDQEICDNIDLDIILQDYCSYYMMRFNKQPQFCRKVEPQVPQRPPTRRKRPDPVEITPEKERDCEDLIPSTFTITKLSMEEPHDFCQVFDKKPLAGFLRNTSPERKELVEMLYQTIIRPSGVSWDDIKGLDKAKSLLMESVVYPVRYPQMFTGALEPWRGVLLHGPPGSGKTLLARGVAAIADCTFFNISCSTVVNKWRGESEKIVQVLFELASYLSPSVVFIDEVESLAAAGCSREHDAARRLRAQLLTQLDGVVGAAGGVFLLANTNAPWDLDPAVLRRLEKRIHIPLPELKTRAELFSLFLHTKSQSYPKQELEELAARTEGYSGSDIKLVCKEALMNNVRKILPDMQKGFSNRREKLELTDILTAIEKTKPISKNLAKRHDDWQNEMGCS